MLDLLEHHQEFPAKLLVKTSSVDHMLSVNQKETKLSAFAKKVGLSFQLTSQKAALTSTSAMNLMDHLDCVESTHSARTETELLTVPVHQDFQATLSNNASTSTNVHDRMLAVKTRFAKTLKVRTLVSAQKAPWPIPIQL